MINLVFAARLHKMFQLYYKPGWVLSKKDDKFDNADYTENILDAQIEWRRAMWKVGKEL